ncbi:hypothetical protein AAG906_029217 [Vitis piasezkii]
MHIAEREQLSYIQGKTNPPKESEDGYEKWYAENQKVKRWLLMSMSPEIMKRYLRLPTTQEIWSALSKVIYDGSDELQVFTLNQKAFTAKQSGRSLSKYYGELTEIFCELDHRDKVVMKDPEDIAAYLKSIKQQRVHIFLVGLDGDFEQVRGEILRKDPLPDLEERYALIRREVVRLASMKGESDNPDTSVMTGHTKSRCFEIVGCPNWWDHNRDQRKKDSKKTSTIVVAKIKTEANVAKKASTLVAATDYGGKKPVGCHLIYTVKYKADGSIERFKARLVAKWYTQTNGIDYTETFALVAKINTVRVLLSLAANLDWPLQQFNVKNAFLHGELSEEVYMDLPPRCMVSKSNVEGVQIKEVIVWVEAIPRAWFGRFTKSMRAFGYRQSNSDHILLPKSNMEMILTKENSQNYLSREFEMKYLGCQPVDAPIEEGLKLCVEPNQVSTDKGRYQRLVRRLMYLSHTRPDLAYALSVVKVYLDVDWVGAVNDRRSTSGYFTFVGGNLVTWKSKSVMSLASSAEAEFRGMTLGLCEALWLRLLLQDLGYLSRQPIRLFCDNKATCDIAHNPVQHDRTKHVEVDRFFIKEKLDDKIVELPKI